MTDPRVHPIDRLVTMAENSAKLMWNAYDVHISTQPREGKWGEKASDIFARCATCDEQVLRLKHLRLERARAWQQARTLASEALRNAEWEILKHQTILLEHHDSPRRDLHWKDQELRILTGLKSAVASLVQVLESES